MTKTEATDLEGLTLPRGFDPDHTMVRAGPEGLEVVFREGARTLEWTKAGGVGPYGLEVHLWAAAARLDLVAWRPSWKTKELLLAGKRERLDYALSFPTNSRKKLHALLLALEDALAALSPVLKGKKTAPLAPKVQKALEALASLFGTRAPFARRGGFALIRGRKTSVLWSAEAAPPELRPLLALLPEGGEAVLPLPDANGAALEASVRPDPEEPEKTKVLLEALRLGQARFLPLGEAAFPLFAVPDWKRLVGLGFGLQKEDWQDLSKGETEKVAKALALRRLEVA